MHFGHLPQRLSVEAGAISIRPLPTWDAAVANVKASGQLSEGWFYPPYSDTSPYPVERFELPPTHEIVHRGTTSVARVQFLILSIGLLLGYRLLPAGHGHLQRTAMRPSLVTDLHVSGPELQRVLPVVDARWKSLRPNERRLLQSSIVAYQWATSCRRRFEELAFLYSALDAIFVLHSTAMRSHSASVGHWGRARELCKHLGVPIPTWARKHPSARSGKGRTKSNLSKQRNELAHEALFAGAPIGYAVDNGTLMLELQNLISRAIVAALGIDCTYSSFMLGTRQMVGIGLRD